jgi:hypothetical protein
MVMRTINSIGSPISQLKDILTYAGPISPISSSIALFSKGWLVNIGNPEGMEETEASNCPHFLNMAKATAMKSIVEVGPRPIFRIIRVNGGLDHRRTFASVSCEGLHKYGRVEGSFDNPIFVTSRAGKSPASMYGRLDAAGRRIYVKMSNETTSADLPVLSKASKDEPGRVFDEDFGGVENRIGFDTLTGGRIHLDGGISIGIMTSAERI